MQHCVAASGNARLEVQCFPYILWVRVANENVWRCVAWWRNVKQPNVNTQKVANNLRINEHRTTETPRKYKRWSRHVRSAIQSERKKNMVFVDVNCGIVIGNRTVLPCSLVRRHCLFQKFLGGRNSLLFYSLPLSLSFSLSLLLFLCEKRIEKFQRANSKNRKQMKRNENKKPNWFGFLFLLLLSKHARTSHTNTKAVPLVGRYDRTQPRQQRLFWCERVTRYATNRK